MTGSEQERKADLVLDAGGVKGIGLVGAVLTLVDAGYSFPRIAGTSAGAVVASLVAAYQKAGRDLHELVEVMNTLDYSRFADRSI
ncbi:MULTISPECIES: patatin-like phospholipase family protein, partial [unclassified Frankia]